ncbi:MAG: MerR family transcriptional regulator [Acidimicrobiales bacterium]
MSEHDAISVTSVVADLAVLDASAVLTAVTAAKAEGVELAELVAEVILPAQREIERRYSAGELDRETRVAAAELLRRALAHAGDGGQAAAGDAASRVGVIITQAETDQLTAEVVTELLAAEGWAVDLLRGQLLPAELRHHFESRKTLAAVLVCQDPAGLPALMHALCSAHEAGVPVLAVGEGFGPDDTWALRAGADGWVGRVEDIPATLESWARESKQPHPGVRSNARKGHSPAPAGNMIHAGPAPSDGVGCSPAGQAFADLLLLAGLACQAPVVLLSVPQTGGGWTTLSSGTTSRQGLNHPALFAAVAARTEPVEFTDLAVSLAASPLSGAPHRLRWAYSVALRCPSPESGGPGRVLGVLAVLDRCLRQASKREQRALHAAARQITGQLLHYRRIPEIAPANSHAAPAPSPPPSLAAAESEQAAAALVEARPSAPITDLAGLRRSAGLSDGQQLMRSHEVATLFDVTERTVINWAAAGKLPCMRTIGGHLRFRSEDVQRLLGGQSDGSTSHAS